MWMNQKLSDIGAHLDGIYFCPHHVKGTISRYARECDCRKPSPKLVFNAAQDFDIDLSASYFVGDSDKDMECAKNAGVTGIHYQYGKSLLKIVQENIR